MWLSMSLTFLLMHQVAAQTCSLGTYWLFEHGVASGDASANSVVLWTRVTPHDSSDYEGETVALRYAICSVDDGKLPSGVLFPSAGTPDSVRAVLKERCRWGRVTTGAYRDFTVKVEPQGLPQNTKFVYQFRLLQSEDYSEIGHTRTMPAVTTDVSSLHYMVMSCSSYPHGYFHSYELAANVKELDFFLHVGDYQYEYGSYNYPSASGVIRQEPFGPYREIVTLREYRQRYALYRSDKSLQKLHRRAPMYAIWDDHEITNDARSDGAQNHQENCTTRVENMKLLFNHSGSCDTDEGDYTKRVDIATRAYFEWLPVSEAGGIFNDPEKRKSRSFEFHFGNLASFVGYDTRLTHRTLSDPTDLFGSELNPLVVFAATNPNVSAWYTEPLLSQLTEAARLTKEDLDGDAEVMGEASRTAMRNFFTESKNNGAPWQVLATPIPMGERYMPDLIDGFANIPTALRDAGVSEEDISFIVATLNGITQASFADAGARITHASGMTKTPWNSDAWDGFYNEREKVLEILRDATNNPIVVAGDSHNARAIELRIGDKQTGDRVAVAYDTQSISSPGMEAYFGQYKANGLDAIGLDAFEYASMMTNGPATRYENLKDRGFIYFSVNRTHHTGEFVFVNEGRGAANESNTQVLSNPEFNLSTHYCDARITTTAGEPGVFSTIVAESFLIPVSCEHSMFNSTFFDELFENTEFLVGRTKKRNLE